MMSDDIRIMPEIYEIYPTLSSILRKYECYGRKDYFRGQGAEHFDMGDIASLIAPRRLMIQSCREDRLAGTRGLTNVLEQVDIIRANYVVTGIAEHVQQDIEDGPHHLDTSHLQDITAWLVE